MKSLVNKDNTKNQNIHDTPSLFSTPCSTVACSQKRGKTSSTTSSVLIQTSSDCRAAENIRIH